MNLDRKIIPKYREDKISEKEILKQVKKLKKKNKATKKPDLDSMDVYNDLEYLPDIPTKKLDAQKVNAVKCHPIFSVINNMMYNGMSPVIFITGDRRLGKSKTALYIADMLHNELNICSGSFIPKEQLLYDELEFLALVGFSKRIVHIADEAHRYLNWKDQRTDFVRAVSSVLDTMAIHNNVHIIVTPKYKKISSGIRDHADFIVNMTSKQQAEVTWYQDKYGKKGTKGLDFKFDEFPTWYIPDIPEEKLKPYEKIENKFKFNDHLDLIEEILEKRIEKQKQKKKAKA